MKIYYSPYTLQALSELSPVSSNRKREGALLKVRWIDGLIGYADLHPWPELGDPTVKEHLARLQEGKITTQVEQSIWLAHRDAVCRDNKKNLLEGGRPLANNFIVSDVAEVPGGLLQKLVREKFTHVKVKVGRSLQRETDFLHQAASVGLKIRLDFNGRSNWQFFEKFISRIENFKSAVEYVEDPVPFNPEIWADARKLVKVALDNETARVNWEKLQEPVFDILVVKPAKTDVQKAMKLCQKWNLQAVITSYMDHPIGSLHALAVAQELKAEYGDMILEAGCLTHSLYHPDIFAKQIQSQGPFIKKVAGHGIGFDQILEEQPWRLIELR